MNIFKYARSNKNQLIVVSFLIFVLLSYIFFFTSKLIILEPITSESDVTLINKNIDFSDSRKIKILSSTYDEGNETLELLMEFQNNNYDGINDYYFVPKIINSSIKSVQTEEVLNNKLLRVVRIYNLKSFNEVQLYVAPKITSVEKTKNDDTIKLVFNEYNTKFKSLDFEKNEKDYLLERINNVIIEIEKEELKLKEEKAKLIKNVKMVEKDIKQIKAALDVMTYLEKDFAFESIEENNNTILRYEEEIQQLDVDLSDCKKKKNDALKTKDTICSI